MGAMYPGMISDSGFDMDEFFLLVFHPNVFDAASVAKAIACLISSADMSTSASSLASSSSDSDADDSSCSSCWWW